MICEYNVKKFCKDDISLIENYDKAIYDKEQTWDCHHRREILISKNDLIENDEYYNRPAGELIFLTKSEHMALHNTLKFKGKTTWNKGKHHSEEAKRKMSIAKKGKNTWSKTLHWWNNGIKNVFSRECPEGFVKGMIKKSNLKIYK